MAGGTPARAALAASIAQLLGNALRGPCLIYSSDLKVRIEATDLTTFPDVTVVCGERQTSPVDPHAVTNPTILVEVTSHSTEDYDRGEKLANYKQISDLRAVLFVSHRVPRSLCFGDRARPGASSNFGLGSIWRWQNQHSPFPSTTSTAGSHSTSPPRDLECTHGSSPSAAIAAFASSRVTSSERRVGGHSQQKSARKLYIWSIDPARHVPSSAIHTPSQSQQLIPVGKPPGYTHSPSTSCAPSQVLQIGLVGSRLRDAGPTY